MVNNLIPLSEQEKQEIKNKIIYPSAKFIGTLLFDGREKFEKKLFAWCEKLKENTNWNIDATSTFLDMEVIVSFNIVISNNKESFEMTVATSIK